MCGVAGMLAKGEVFFTIVSLNVITISNLLGEGGADVNITKAVLLYEEAASMGSIRALNGLGYMYFYGQGVAKNEVSVHIT
jgi:TPR repeat protein